MGGVHYCGAFLIVNTPSITLWINCFVYEVTESGEKRPMIECAVLSDRSYKPQRQTFLHLLNFYLQ